jgi:hypothetical protein
VKCGHCRADKPLDAFRPSTQLKGSGWCRDCHDEYKRLPDQVAKANANHATGVVRALLCHQCNLILGNAGDDIALLEAAISYLRRFAVVV